MKTLIITAAVVGLLTFAAWRVRARVDQSRADEAAKLNPPTVIAPAVSDGALSYRDCDDYAKTW